MEAPDTRGAGGRAQRGRNATPGKLFGIVSSPLQLISKTVKGLVGNERVSPTGNGAAASLSPPSCPLGKASPAEFKEAKGDEGPATFSFPTLTVSDDSPPANALLRPAGAAQPSSQPRAVGQDALLCTPASAQAPAAVAPLPSSSKELVNGWSPSKLASLNFFLTGASQYKLSQGAADDMRPPAPACLPSFDVKRTTEIYRPYQGLKALLRAGPGGFVSGSTSPSGVDGGAANARPVTGLNASLASGTAPHAPAARHAMGTSLRYNPYARPPIAGRPPRPGSNGGASGLLQHSTQPLLDSGCLGVPPSTLSQPEAEQPISLSVATAQLPPVNPRAPLHPSGAPPRPPVGAGGIRLAPGQVAFSSGRTGTPLPKFGQLPVPAAGQQPAAQTPGGFRPLLGAVVGAKRQRDSPAASPLMASGVRSLSEFKRRRQVLPQQPRSVLAGLSARTPRAGGPSDRESEHTPGGASGGPNGTSGVTTPSLASGGASAVDVPATDTARKILITLENISRASDQAIQSGTPHGTASKHGAPSALRSGAPSVTPLPGGFMPPLERLDQNHYGGTPTPTATPTLVTAAAGFVSGATPSPLGMGSQAGSTPGPRIALDFQSPAASQPRSSGGLEPSAAAADTPGRFPTASLPLSPIAVASAPPARERVPIAQAEEPATDPTASGPAVQQAASGGPTETNTDVGPDVHAPCAAGAPGSDRTSEASTSFSFRSPSVPSDPRVRAANEVVGKSSAAAANAPAGNVPAFRFTPPSVGIASSAQAAAAEGSTTAVGVTQPSALGSIGKASTAQHDEVQRAAAVPLPDDDDDEDGAPEPTVPPVTVPPIVEVRPLMQPPKEVPAGTVKRVGFAEPPPIEKPVDKVTAPPMETAKAATTPPPASGGFVVADAGATPFRPASALATTPSTIVTEKVLPAGDQPAPFSFGIPQPSGVVKVPEVVAEPTKPPVEAAMPQTSSFGFGNTVSFNAPPSSTPAVTSTTASVITAPAPASAASSSAAVSFGAAAAGAAPNLPAAPQASTGFSFGTAAAAPAFGAAAVPSAPSSASAAATASASTGPQFVFGAATQPSSNGTGQTFTFGTAPAASAPAATAATTSGGTSTSATPFTFGTSSAQPPTTAVNASVSAAPIGPSFNFGASAASVATAAPPNSFGSPLPASNPASAPSFGSSQPAVGFSLGPAAAPGAPASVGFTFGAQGNGASAGGTPPGGAGFGAPSGPSAPASTFSFGGAGNSATPPFGAAAPSFGATPAAQPTFGASAPSFGAAASAPSFGAAAPSFGAQAMPQPFGAPQPAAASAFGAAAPQPSPAPTPSFGGFGATVSNGGAQTAGMFTFGGGAAPSFGSVQAAPSPAPVFGQAPAPTFGAHPPQQPAQAPAFGGFGAPAPGGMGGFGAQAQQLPFSGAPPSPGGDAGGGFSLGLGDPKDGRKRVKARRHGH